MLVTELLLVFVSTNPTAAMLAVNVSGPVFVGIMKTVLVRAFPALRLATLNTIRPAVLVVTPVPGVTCTTPTPAGKEFVTKKLEAAPGPALVTTTLYWATSPGKTFVDGVVINTP